MLEWIGRYYGLVHRLFADGVGCPKTWSGATKISHKRKILT